MALRRPRSRPRRTALREHPVVCLENLDVSRVRPNLAQGEIVVLDLRRAFDGAVVRDPEFRVDMDHDRIEIDGGLAQSMDHLGSLGRSLAKEHPRGTELVA